MSKKIICKAIRCDPGLNSPVYLLDYILTYKLQMYEEHTLHTATRSLLWIWAKH